MQVGATWLLKRHLECGGKLSSAQVRKIYASLDQLSEWEAILHVLQCMPEMPVPKGQIGKVAQFLRDCLAHKRPFVRAWAYNGFHELAVRHEIYREEMTRLIAHAAQNEAASVKARLRNIVKQSPLF